MIAIKRRERMLCRGVDLEKINMVKSNSSRLIDLSLLVAARIFNSVIHNNLLVPFNY